MVDTNRSEPQQGELPLPQILVFIGLTALLVGFLLLRGVTQPPTNSNEVRVFFANIEDGDTLPTTFTIQMGAEGVEVQPSGEVVEGAGHMHILVDHDFVPAGEVIPGTDGYVHFGDGSTTTELTLVPGEHTLRLQFADGLHTALAGDEYRDEVTITVAE